jgi:hypothetical protein
MVAASNHFTQLPAKIVSYPLYMSPARWRAVKWRLAQGFFIFDPGNEVILLE